MTKATGKRSKQLLVKATEDELKGWHAHAWVYAKSLAELVRDLLQQDRERLEKKGVTVPKKLPERD